MMRKKTTHIRKMILAITGVVAFGYLALPAVADDHLDPVAARVQIMKDTGAAMRVLSKAVKGQGEIGMLHELAATTITETGKAIPDLFAAGTGPSDPGIGETRAKPEIWSDPDGFLMQAKALEDAGAALSAAVAANDLDALAAGLDMAGKSCGGCHKPYRVPKD